MKEYLESESIAAEYDDAFGELNLFRLDTEILDSIFTVPSTMLDLGCGSGRHVLHFAKRKFSVTGIDFSLPMLEISKKKIQAEGLVARLVHGNIEKLETIPNDFFHGAVCMFSTLGMIKGKENRKNFLKQLWRKIKIGGKFVLHAHNTFFDVWNPPGLWWLIKNFTYANSGVLDFGDKRFENYRGIAKMPLHLFTVWEMKQLLQNCGFAVKKVYPLSRARDRVFAGSLPYLRCNGFITCAEKISSSVEA